MTIDQALLEEATDLVREAGRLTLRWFRSADLDVERKGDGTPVTIADKTAERFLREELGKRFPNDAIAGEEEADTDGTSGRRWVIDPIDGTIAFTQGVPLYTNLLGLWDVDGCALGVINMPALEETVYAARGLGCWCNGAPAKVSDTAQVDRAFLSTSGFGYWPEAPLLAVKRAGFRLRTWGDGYGYALVATGRADVMVDPEVAEWDVAPMPVILEEAGGRFTSWSGDVTATGGDGVATNGILHEQVQTLLGG